MTSLCTCIYTSPIRISLMICWTVHRLLYILGLWPTTWLSQQIVTVIFVVTTLIDLVCTSMQHFSSSATTRGFIFIALNNSNCIVIWISKQFLMLKIVSVVKTLSQNWITCYTHTNMIIISCCCLLILFWSWCQNLFFPSTGYKRFNITRTIVII